MSKDRHRLILAAATCYTISTASFTAAGNTAPALLMLLNAILFIIAWFVNRKDVQP